MSKKWEKLSTLEKSVIVGGGVATALAVYYYFQHASKSGNDWDMKSYPDWGENNKSLAKKYCTKELWDKLKDKQTKQGFTLARAIRSGVINQDSGIGIYAGDMESYSLFREVFDPLIEEYHNGHTPTSKHTSDMDPSHLKTDVVDKNNLIKSTRIRVARNLKGYGLSPGMSRENRQKVEQMLIKAFQSLSGEFKGKYYPLGSMTEQERQQLVDDHFLFKKGDRFLEEAGCNREWPEGRGIFHNDNKTFLIWVNEEDTMRIISMQKGGDVKAVFTRLANGIKAIEDSLKQLGCEFQHDDHLGYYSSCPTNLGTGMRGSVHIRLEKVSKRPDFYDWAKKNHLQIRGIHGEHSESVDPVFDISNRYRLGHSEVELVEMMAQGVNKLIEMELSS